MPLPLPVQRLAYRCAYPILQIWWFIAARTIRGVKCLLSDGNQVLLVRHTYGPRRWDLPGGAVECGECPQRAARREMREELGLDVANWESAGSFTISGRRRTDELHVFRVELHRPELRIDSVELQTTRWFARDGLPADLAPLARTILEHIPAENLR